MAKITLAGYNLDSEIIDEIRRGKIPDEMTPETLSAAYARISRDSRPVHELRREARAEVEKARRSNQRIVFQFGHHSVAEHAVFNFDILGVSRLAIEALESHRLASYTEKSQRYIRLDEEVVIPQEVQLAGLGAPYQAFVRRSFARYQMLLAGLVECGIPESLAMEDARYAMPLAVPGQLGMTINARSLEHLIKRLFAHPLAEVRDLARSLLDAAEPVAPSLLMFMDPGLYDLHRYEKADEAAREIFSKKTGRKAAKKDGSRSQVSLDPKDNVSLVTSTENGGILVLAALVQGAVDDGFSGAIEAVSKLKVSDHKKIFSAVTANMSIHDAPPREFEHAAITFELIMSAAAYGQFKRHRMASLTVRPYDPSLGVMIPPTIRDIGLSKILEDAAEDALDLAKGLGYPSEPASAYVLLNAHRRRAVLTANLREFYHISRLREDSHAQWDIRSLVSEMSRMARSAFPVCGALLGGKDSVVEMLE